MDRKRIQCLSITLQHVPIYFQPFLRYSKLLVENCFIFTPHLCLAATRGVTPSEFREDLDTHKTRMNGLSCGEEIMTIRSAVLIQCQRVTDKQTDRRTDGRTDVQPISITCFSIVDARKNKVARFYGSRCRSTLRSHEDTRGTEGEHVRYSISLKCTTTSLKWINKIAITSHAKCLKFEFVWLLWLQIAQFRR